MEEKNGTAVIVSESTAVKKQEPMGFDLVNISQAYRLATALSRSGLIPTALKGKPDDILVVLMSGRELGIPPMQSLRHLYVIEGRISMSAAMMLGRVLKSDACEYFTVTETTDKSAKATTKRKGSPAETHLEFTIGDAMQMGLANRDNWKKQPATMLRWRVVTALSRLVYPDVVEGIYSEDESEDIRESARGMAGAMGEMSPEEEARASETRLRSAITDGQEITGGTATVVPPESAAEKQEVPKAGPAKKDSAPKATAANGNQSAEPTPEEKAAIQAREKAEAAAHPEPTQKAGPRVTFGD